MRSRGATGAGGRQPRLSREAVLISHHSIKLWSPQCCARARTLCPSAKPASHLFPTAGRSLGAVTSLSTGIVGPALMLIQWAVALRRPRYLERFARLALSAPTSTFVGSKLGS